MTRLLRSSMLKVANMRPRNDESRALLFEGDRNSQQRSVRSDHPAYQYMRDPDGDGVVCE